MKEVEDGLDESEKIKQLINQIVSELLKQTKEQPVSVIKKAKRVLIIENEKTPLNKFSNQFEQSLAQKYELIKKKKEQLQETEIDELILEIDQIVLTNASLSLQSKLALGLGDCPLSLLLQEALVHGIPTIILADYLVETSQIQSDSYQRLFIKYQRIIKEHGIVIKKSKEFFKDWINKKKWITANEIALLDERQHLVIGQNDHLSYSAKEQLKKKKIQVIKTRGD